MATPLVEEKVFQEGAEGEPVCRHHWVIESPHGATSHGICKICGEERDFQNSASDTLWEGDPMRSISRMGGGSRPVVREKAPVADD
jgi:hypothetical protein